MASRIVAGMVTSPSKPSQPQVETKPDGGAEDGLLEGEEKEDLPTQPPPIEQKPKESKNLDVDIGGRFRSGVTPVQS